MEYEIQEAVDSQIVKWFGLLRIFHAKAGSKRKGCHVVLTIKKHSKMEHKIKAGRLFTIYDKHDNMAHEIQAGELLTTFDKHDKMAHVMYKGNVEISHVKISSQQMAMHAQACLDKIVTNRQYKKMAPNQAL